MLGGATGGWVGSFQSADEHGPNSAPYMVLSDSLWRSAFNADPGVIGTTGAPQQRFLHGGRRGARAQFHGTEQFVVAGLLHPRREPIRRRTPGEIGRAWPLTVLGRLKPGVTPAAGCGKSECDRGPTGQGSIQRPILECHCV